MVCAPPVCLNEGRCDETDQPVDRPGVANGEKCSKRGKIDAVGLFCSANSWPIPSFNLHPGDREERE